MHFVLLTRGAPEQVNIWKKFMETQMFWWKRQPLLKDEKGEFIPDGVDENGNPKYKRGKEFIQRVQGALRPIQFYEYVFPEECYPEVLAMMNLQDQIGHIRPEVAMPAWFVRKIMKLKPCPVVPEILGKKTEEITTKFVPTNAVATYPIGVRSDFKKDFIFTLEDGTKAGFYQEGL